MIDSTMSLGQLATLASILEVTIPKPGNVHRSADFEDTTFQDFLISAVAIGPAMDLATQRPLGDTILNSVHATRSVVKANTNLGIILLLAPLATLSAEGGFDPQPELVRESLRHTTIQDCQKIYQAISLCEPGGLGQTEAHDIDSGVVPPHIVDAMSLAEDRDLIARQYVNGFVEVTRFVLPEIESAVESGAALSESVIQAHLKTMYQFPDSLIARKNGREVALQSAAMAGDVLSSGCIGDPGWLKALGEFDFWLRADGNRRNPGTTADLIAAALFAGLRRGSIDLTRNRF